MHLCLSCLGRGFCRKLTTYLVTDKEMTPAFLRDARNTGYELAREYGLSSGRYPHWLLQIFAKDFRGTVRDGETGREADLDLEALLRPADVLPETWEAWLNLDEDPPEDQSFDYRTWWRDHFAHPSPATPRIVYRERLRVALTLIRACFPKRAENWGKITNGD